MYITRVGSRRLQDTRKTGAKSFDDSFISLIHWKKAKSVRKHYVSIFNPIRNQEDISSQRQHLGKLFIANNCDGKHSQLKQTRRQIRKRSASLRMRQKANNSSHRHIHHECSRIHIYMIGFLH